MRLSLVISMLVASFATFFVLLAHQRRESSSPAASPGSPSPTLPALPRPLPEFSLLDTAGRPVCRSDLLGRIVVFNFVFTSCSLSCRSVNRRMAEIQLGVADLPEVLLISFSIDPRTDTPKALAAFAEEFGADSRRWRFLTQHPADPPASRTVGWIANVEEWMPLVPEGSLGTERILLVDPDGVVRESFDGLQPEVARTVLQSLRQRLSSRPPSSALNASRQSEWPRHTPSSTPP